MVIPLTHRADKNFVIIHILFNSALFYHPLFAILLPPKVNFHALILILRKAVIFELVHRYGPCFQHKGGYKPNFPSQREILLQDQSRFKWIQSRFSEYSGRSDKKNTNAATIPISNGEFLNTLNYVVRVGLGTPVQYVLLTLDTGSDLLWTQCEPPCSTGNCYQQNEPKFDTRESITYTNISCSAPMCETFKFGAEAHQIVHAQHAPMASGTQTLHIPSDLSARKQLPEPLLTFSANFYFGCGQNNPGLFGSVGGLLGLNRNPISFPSQTAYKYEKFFSYCIPSSASTTGHLIFGNAGGLSKIAKFTPNPPAFKNASFYGLDITGISFAGKNLSIPRSVFTKAGAIIDSGVVVTRLPVEAYSGYTGIPVPDMSFFFGDDVEVKLDVTGILYVVSASKVCLAFSPIKNADEVTVFGNAQQKTLEVVYDGVGERVGFAPRGCS
ncbi:hypothetical protein Patl1_12628 [Pistacia atlantica]|uniref:Uncharacterized protein n=1 Tax=Pistacia atlantica TaxID=434234 RepID=A0ACC1ATU1_9ROSI|nr:hypothetical protein Patl1_12628 [Pistacia atlantica]